MAWRSPVNGSATWHPSSERVTLSSAERAVLDHVELLVGDMKRLCHLSDEPRLTGTALSGRRRGAFDDAPDGSRFTRGIEKGKASPSTPGRHFEQAHITDGRICIFQDKRG